MTYEFVELTSQAATAHWGWTIAFFLWFVGLAGMSLFLNWWLRSKRFFYVATAAAIIGTLLVVSHLARMLNLPMAAINALIEWKFNFGSWMFIGICILAVLCIVTVIESLLVIAAQKKEPGNEYETFLESDIVAWLNAILGVAATAYSGFLLTQAAGVALWNTAALPVHLIDLSEDEISQIIEAYPYLIEVTIPGGTYDGIDEDVHTVGTPQGAQTTKNLSQQDG